MVTVLKNEINEFCLVKIERCVLCGKKTPYLTINPISERYYYVEGCGQLCEKCAVNIIKHQ